jgi:hypothetical protein
MHAVAVVFDFMQPLVALRRRVDQLGQLRRDPLRQGRCVVTASYRPRQAGSGNSLLRRRAAAAGIATKFGNHSFRATGITAYLKIVI